MNKKRSDRQSGITLIELLVAMAIVGAIFALSASGLRQAFDLELKNSSRRLSSLMRYLRIQAVTEHKYLRLCLDMEKDEYWVEETKESFVIASSDEEQTDVKKAGEKEKASDALSAEGEEKEAGDEASAKGSFQESDKTVVKRKKLGSGVLFKDVSVSYLPMKAENGQVYVYFFPDGYATPAMIHLQNEDDDAHYSLEVFPLTGKVEVEGEYREWEKK